MSVVDIKEFPVHRMKAASKIFAIGGTGCGKSTLMVDLLYHQRHKIASAVLISAADDEKDPLIKLFPDAYIHNKMHPMIITSFVQRQKLLMASHCPYSFASLCIDDSGYDQKFVNSKQMQYIMKLNRHNEMQLLFSMHGAKGANKKIRHFIDYAFIGKEKSYEEREALYKNYASMIPSFDLFQDIMDKVTVDKQFLVIDLKNDSNEMKDCVFSYKAQLHPNFSLGCQEWHDWARLRYNPNYTPTFEI